MLSAELYLEMIDTYRDAKIYWTKTNPNPGNADYAERQIIYYTLQLMRVWNG